jgi:uncharacterized membrane protein
MNADALHEQPIALKDAESCLALGAGALLLLVGASRRSAFGAGLAVSAAPLLYRGVMGYWPSFLGDGDRRVDTKVARAADRGVRVLESVRLEMPVAVVFSHWRRLEQLPRFMSHLDQVTETSDGRSHWVAAGPAGLRVEWDAEITDEVHNHLLAWRSLPGSDVDTTGSVNFDEVRGSRSTQVTLHLQYAPPAGKAGAHIASLFGREPSQTIREDLRRFKHLLEAGEIPRATASA